MVRFGKKVAVLTLAGAIAAMSVTGCGSIKGKDHAWSGKFLCKTAAGAV